MTGARLPILVVAATVALATVAGCGDGSGSETVSDRAPGTQVVIETFQFEPESIRVEVGTTVTWTNRDDILHTVTASPDATATFDQTLDGDGSTASVTFDEPGRYDYFCNRHNAMTGTVVVR